MSAQIVLENVGVRYPMRTLFDQVNFTLYDGQRISLAGRNGSGKSTLLKILAGEMEPTEGRRNTVGSRKLRIGYLDQSLLDSTVASILQSKDASLSPLAFARRQLEKEVNEDDYYEDRDWEIKRTLSGLGFSQELMESSINKLSGGWLLRLFIGNTLLQRPEVLLLDEPTNHLDLSSIQWLEEFLKKEYKGSLILITHDVELQKRTTDSIAILHGARFFFRTDTHDYLSFQASLVEEKRVLEKQIDDLQKKIDHNRAFADKFKAKASLASRAQSKLKGAEDMEEDLHDLKERLSHVEGNAYNLHFGFRLSAPGGKFPLSAKNVSFRYKDDAPWILKDINIDIKRSQTIAIIGDNGAGKTTLLNVLADRLKPQTGEVMQGHACSLGYFGQHQLDELILDASLLENLRDKASFGLSIEQLRGWLGAFGFRGQHETDKKAKVLSGGERARLALLRILVTPINICLLDEPTNHLDVETKELLKEAIRSFEGTIIFVSHDRDFVESLAQRILYVTVDHKLTDHLGDLDSFFEKYPEHVRHLDGAKKLTSPAMSVPKEEKKKEGPQLSYEERKKLRNLIKGLEKKIAAVEVDIQTIGAEKDALNAEAAKSSNQQEVFKKIAALETVLHGKMVDWEKWSTELEVLKQKYPQ